MSDFITISSSALPDNTRVAAFRATETLSRPYEVEVFLLVPSDELELADGIGSKARLILDRSDDKLPPFYFAGVFASLELLHEFDGRVLVRGIIVPRIWQLGLSHHSRVFTKMSVPEIIEAVLGDNALSGDDYELRLGSYAKEEHVCQYRESDLAFLSRWMEREGIFYFFEHTDEGEKLIICDDKSYNKDPIGTPVRYHPQAGGDMSAGASFRSFRCRYATLPATVKLKDYDYTKPNLDVSGVAPVSDGGAAEVSVYGERFFSPSDGKRLAQLRAESFKAREVTYQALGTRLHVRTGYVFELEDHPRAPFNMEYLAIEVTHSGNQATGGAGFREFITLDHQDVYLVEVSAIPAKTQFRADRATTWPRIYGFENGVVDGSADSEYAQIDDQGRYNVKFKFDESALKNGKASTYIRMMQPHGGSPEGFHFPLRKGTEVVLSFLGGDPDRPVISGVVPNTLLPSPVTSSNHTRNVIQTGGRNRMEFEDLSGQQWIRVSTPYEKTFINLGLPYDGTHEMQMQTDKDTLLNAGANFDLKVGQIANGGTWDTIVKTNMKTYVEEGGYGLGVKLAPWVPGAGKYSLKVLSDISTQTTTGNYSLHVDAGTSSTKVHSHTSTEVAAGSYTVNVTGGPTTVHNTNNSTTIDSHGPVTLESKAAAMTIKASQAIMMKSLNNKIDIEAPSGDITMTAPGHKITVKCHTFKDDSDYKWSTWGEASDLVKGKCTIYKLGEWFEMGVSAKMEISAAIKIAASLSLSLEFAKGLAIKNASGPAEIKVTSINLRTATVTIEKQDATVKATQAVTLSRSGVTII